MAIFYLNLKDLPCPTTAKIAKLRNFLGNDDITTPSLVISQHENCSGNVCQILCPCNAIILLSATKMSENIPILFKGLHYHSFRGHAHCLALEGKFRFFPNYVLNDFSPMPPKNVFVT